eukprot:scaffold17794_cov57-Phaeocystis_antarctica.AAC.3
MASRTQPQRLRNAHGQLPGRCRTAANAPCRLSRLYWQPKMNLRHPAIVRRRGCSGYWVSQRGRSDQLAPFGTKNAADWWDRLAQHCGPANSQSRRHVDEHEETRARRVSNGTEDLAPVGAVIGGVVLVACSAF